MDVDSLWTNILGELELEVTRGTFASFFKGTRLEHNVNNQTVTVCCPNSASSIMLQSRYAPLIKNHIEKRLQTPISLEFKILTKSNPIVADIGPLFTQTQAISTSLRDSGLNPHYAFDNYAVSETNQMAFAASQAVANKPGVAYNPLFLWGPTGVGKTHLMQAIGRQILVKNPQASVLFCTGEEFTNEIIEAIRGRSTAAFKRKYRSATILMVDDIQFIAGRETVQMEFFHTFNSILHAGGQVILTSDKPPTSIDKLEARLRSRFEGGLIVDVAPPTFELRTAILLIKARERGFELSIDIAKQIAARFEDIRALEGALLRFTSEQEHEFDTSKIVARITSSEPSLEKKKVDPKRVLEIAGGFFDLKPSQLVGQSRKKHIALPRQLIMFLLRTEVGLSLEEIGSVLGGRDHTTIMHGVEKISLLLPKSESLRSNLTALRQLLWK